MSDRISTSLSSSFMVSNTFAYKPFSFAQYAFFQLVASKVNSEVPETPIFLVTAGSITKGPIPIVNSDNFIAAFSVAST